MKIVNIKTPIVLGYYLSDKYKELIQEKCRNGHCEIPEGDSSQLYMVIDYDSDLFAAFKLYLSKTEKITMGAQYKYEYELGIKGTEEDIIFEIETENLSIYRCKLKFSNIENACTIL
jgi:hypothetical protein